MRILVADDDAVSRRWLERAITSWGYVVEVARDGAQAWALLDRADAPRMALLDWMMPQIDGAELCRRLKERTAHPYTYAILLTSRSGREDRVAGFRAGADDFVSKPVDPDELKARMEVGRRILEYERAIASKNERLHTLINSIPDLVCFKDASGGILEINDSFAKMLGLSAKDCIGRSSTELSLVATRHADNLSAHDELDDQAWVENETIASEETFVHELRDARIYSVLRVPLLDGEGSRKGLLYLARDVTERKAVEERLRNEATHDLLTGLLTRRHFQRALEAAVSAATRYGHPLSLCISDVDEFKNVNDTYGHTMGDSVLSAFAEIIRGAIRTPDVPGRFGGDEFCIIFPNTPGAGARIAVERIRTRLESLRFDSDGQGPLSVTGSFGVAELQLDGSPMAALFEEADRALYEAKRLGGNSVRLAGSETESAACASGAEREAGPSS